MLWRAPLLIDHAAACAGSLPTETPSNPRRRMCGKAIVFARKPIDVPVEFAALLRTQCSSSTTFADIPAGGTIRAGAPVLTVLVAGETARDVEPLLRDRVAWIRRVLGC